MSKKVLGISLLLAIGVGLGLYLVLNPGQPRASLADFGWEHPAFAAAAAQPPHGDAPVLECWDCHGAHPDKTGAPPASGMLCFDCHTIAP